MSKVRKYYAIMRIVSNNLAQQNIFTVKAGQLIDYNEVTLTVGHNIAFKTKKEAVEQLSFAPHPSMLTIIEIYLILEK